MAPLSGSEAQGDSSATGSARPGGTCWMRARPAPQCRAFLVTEFGVEKPFVYTTWRASSPAGPSNLITADFETRLMFTVGAMLNRGSTSAIGGTVTVDNRDPDGIVPARLELRYRRWRSDSGLDFGGGVARFARHGQFGASGLTAAAGLDYRYIGADARVDVLRADGRTRLGGFVGAKATSLAAPLVVAAGLVFIVIAFSRVD